MQIDIGNGTMHRISVTNNRMTITIDYDSHAEADSFAESIGDEWVAEFEKVKCVDCGGDRRKIDGDSYKPDDIVCSPCHEKDLARLQEAVARIKDGA